MPEQGGVHPRYRAGGHRALRRDVGAQDVGTVGERGGRLHPRRDGAVLGRSPLGPWWGRALGTLPGDARKQWGGNAEVELVLDAERGSDLVAQRVR